MVSRHLPVSDPPLLQKIKIDEDELTIATMDHPHGGSPVSEDPSGPTSAIDNDIPTSLAKEDNNHVTSTSTTTDAPPYWISQHTRTTSSVSYQSLNNTRPTAILLEDHSEEGSYQTQSCWAQSVHIDEYVIVSGPTGIGAYVVWACTVRTLKGGDLSLRKR